MQTSPLSDDEEAVWRALARVVIVLPRLFDAALLRRENLTHSEYLVLMHLSEAPDRSRRMSELATGMPITPSGLTRLVERLEREGMVARRTADGDRRSQIATLTEAGLERLRSAWPAHLDDVRRIVIDNLSELDLPTLTRALNAIATQETDTQQTRRRSAM